MIIPKVGEKLRILRSPPLLMPLNRIENNLIFVIIEIYVTNDFRDSAAPHLIDEEIEGQRGNTLFKVTHGINRKRKHS